MAIQLPPLTKAVSPGMRWLISPMLLVSVVFHLVLLGFPTALQVQKQIEAPKDQKSTKIRTIKIPPKLTRPAPKPIPKVARKTAIPPVAKPSPTPEAEASPTPSPTPTPTASPAPVGSPSPSASPSPTPAADKATEAFELFIGSFQNSLPDNNRSASNAVTPDVLAEPEKFYKFPDQFFDGEQYQVGQPGLESSVWIPLITPEEAIPIFLQYAQANSAVLTEAGSYGGGTVLKADMGGFQRYLIVVPTSIRPTGTIIFIWKGLPSG